LTLAPDVLLLWGDERWPGGTESSAAFEWLQFAHQPQATLEGSGSFVLDGNDPTPLPPFEDEFERETLYTDFLPPAVVERPAHQGWFTVVDGRGRGRQWIKDGGAFGEAWQGWRLLVFVARQTPPAYLAYLRREDIPYLVAGDERVDLSAALEKLREKLDITTVLSTAGGRLNGALLRASLVDEVNVELLPAVIGGFDTPSLFDSPALAPGEEPTRLALISVQVGNEGRVWLRYRVVSEEAR